MRDRQLVTYLETSTAFVTGSILSPKPKPQFINLSEVLEIERVPERYFLTAKACAGILRRAEKRGKDLPLTLAHALKAVACSEPTSTSTVD